MIFVRYIAIQVLAYSIDMGVFLASIYLGSLGPIISNTFGKIAAGIFAFLAHRKFTFRLDRKKYKSKQIYRYFVLLGLNVPVSAGVLSAVLLVINDSTLAKFLSDALNFVLLGLNMPVSSGVLSAVLPAINNLILAKFLSDVLIVLFTFWLSKAWVFAEDGGSSSNGGVVP